MSVNVLYRTSARATGGRDGHSATLDGAVDVKLSTPKELGGAGGPGVNPEQLFAHRTQIRGRLWPRNRPGDLVAGCRAKRRRGASCESASSLPLLKRNSQQYRREAHRGVS